MRAQTSENRADKRQKNKGEGEFVAQQKTYRALAVSKRKYKRKRIYVAERVQWQTIVLRKKQKTRTEQGNDVMGENAHRDSGSAGIEKDVKGNLSP